MNPTASNVRFNLLDRKSIRAYELLDELAEVIPEMIKPWDDGRLLLKYRFEPKLGSWDQADSIEDDLMEHFPPLEFFKQFKENFCPFRLALN